VPDARRGYVDVKSEYQHGIAAEDGGFIYYEYETFSSQAYAVTRGSKYWDRPEAAIVLRKRHVSEWEAVP
jgi:hypothetical protein